MDVDKDQYLNRNEYDEGYDHNQMQHEHMYNVEAIHENKYYENSPIIENTEGEMTVSPQKQLVTEGNQSHAKYYNDKSHLIWEQERIQRKREEYYRRANPMTMHEYFKDPSPLFSTSTTRGKLMAYDFTKQPKTSSSLVNHLKSKVPILSDHYKTSVTHSAAASDSIPSFERVFNAYMSSKRNDGLSNIFNQSEYQQRLQKGQNVNNDRAPMTHSSLSKNTIDFNTARYNSSQSIVDGRQRMFHSSQVF